MMVVVVMMINVVITTSIYNYMLRIQGTRSFGGGDHFSTNKYR